MFSERTSFSSRTSEPHPGPGPSRRSVLAGGLVGIGAGLAGAGFLIQNEVLPGRVALARALGQTGEPGTVPTVTALGEIRRGSFDSQARGGWRPHLLYAGSVQQIP